LLTLREPRTVTASEPLGGGMDIHKPKPWHGWREFLKEYVIIVVGVLTALAAEQGVEWLHWRHEVASARETLRPEYLRIIRQVGVRVAQSPCIAARVDALNDILDQANLSGRLPPIGPVLQPTRDPWTLRGWEAVVSDQVLPHIPREEVLLETSIAARTDYLVRIRDSEMDHWAVLGGLMGPGRKVEPGELAGYRTALGLAAREAGLIRSSASLLVPDIVNTGVVTRTEATKAWEAGMVEGQRWIICHPLGSTPIRFSAMQGPGLSAPPKTPFLAPDDPVKRGLTGPPAN
jgi:hypothetical protein